MKQTLVIEFFTRLGLGYGYVADKWRNIHSLHFTHPSSGIIINFSIKGKDEEISLDRIKRAIQLTKREQLYWEEWDGHGRRFFP